MVAIEEALKAVMAGVTALVGAAYVRGWWRLRAAGHEPPRWRLALYLLALVTAVVALLALDEAAETRFSVHMSQHLLLTMVVAPLALLGNPLAPILWGVPPRARRALAAPLRPGARGRATLSALTSLPAAGVVSLAAVWLWHVPAMYDAAAEHVLVHVAEHVTLLATACLFWWPIVLPAPRLRRPAHPGFQILYLILATAQNSALGMLLSIPERAFYPHYVRTAAELGISPVNDQMLGGGLMWSMGHMYLLPILVILYGIARRSVAEPDDAPAASG